MKKTIATIMMLIAITTIATAQPAGTICDLYINLDPNMWVVGDGCHNSDRTTDSQAITVPEAGNHQVIGLVHRGNPDQCQLKEEFYTTINGVNGSIVTDKENPCGEATLWEPLGTFPFTTGDNTIHMTTAAQCPPDELANSVEMTELCIIYEDIPEAPEFSSLAIALAALLTTPAFAYLLVKRRE